jgi:hypothetical protein
VAVIVVAAAAARMAMTTASAAVALVAAGVVTAGIVLAGAFIVGPGTVVDAAHCNHKTWLITIPTGPAPTERGTWGSEGNARRTF